MKIMLLFASLAFADQTTQPAAHAKAIYPAIKAKSSASSIDCPLDDREECALTWTPRAGETIVFDDKQARLLQLKALLQKWINGTITNAEKDTLQRAIARLVLSKEL